MIESIQKAFDKFQDNKDKINKVYYNKIQSVDFDGSYEDLVKITNEHNIKIEDVYIFSDESRPGSLEIDTSYVTDTINIKATNEKTLKRNQSITKRYCEDALEESGFKRIGCVPNGRNFTEKLNFNENSIDYIVDFYKNFYRI